MIQRTVQILGMAPAAAAMMIAACLGGCGRSDIGKVAGRVTYDGQPRSGLEVRFNPVAPGRGSVGYTDDNGEYEAQYSPNQVGALIGEHSVAVMDRSGRLSIPPEFSDLKFEVESGSNRFDINIPAP